MEWASNIIEELNSYGKELSMKKFRFLDEYHPYNDQGEINIHRDIYESRPQQLLFRLKSILGLNLSTVYARDTEVVDLTKKQAQKFIDTNHLMGFGGGNTFLGLRDDTELVAVAAFSKILFMKYEDPPYHSVELERYCSLMDTTVVGGVDKLIKAYLKDHQVDDIVTYVDKEWSDGSSYEKLGFEIIGKTEPLTFKVDKKTWERELVRDTEKIDTSRASVSEEFYYVKNQGNLKMRLQVKK